ncbi:TIGR03761 family integrating conjugative element protein [Pseudomonas protegens]|uniref:TIGR03761 family integrating conjugative element protein n=1 Tax=Pseudomonas protegens TaxID=380021 RepID=A0A2T6GB48_9PSED|nr:TIGR03761 family integrating conjugative element protein [Pseudomonas protegens]PUA41371.1 TIGR03761 family integrating conjugative element protein [Pseudomonas protegens]
MTDNRELAIGSLRSDVQLTLHTHHAARLWMGRARNDTKPGILGLSGFCAIINRLHRGCSLDDPYSDLWMILIEEKVIESRQALASIEERLDAVMAVLPPAISISNNLSIQPAKLPLFISNPLGFQAVYLLTSYDEIVRRILLAQHVGLIGRRDMELWIDEGATLLRRLFGLAQLYRYSGACRDDFAANNAKAEAARQMYQRHGELPQDILEGTRRSTYAPPIARGQQTETEDNTLLAAPVLPIDGDDDINDSEVLA